MTVGDQTRFKEMIAELAETYEPEDIEHVFECGMSEAFEEEEEEEEDDTEEDDGEDDDDLEEVEEIEG